MERFRAHWEYLRTSLCFVPGVMALGAMLLAAFTIAVERRMTAVEPDIPWYIYVAKEADAQAVLSTILSSMITMASLVFSITMVVLTLAASQFGPRLIRSFMADPQTQLVLGTLRHDDRVLPGDLLRGRRPAKLGTAALSQRQHRPGPDCRQHRPFRAFSAQPGAVDRVRDCYRARGP